MTVYAFTELVAIDTVVKAVAVALKAFTSCTVACLLELVVALWIVA